MKTRRQTKILELINEYEIDTQEELLRRLREDGLDVTQATVSRDIKELRLIKTLSSEGKYKYSTAKDTAKDYSFVSFSIFSSESWMFFNSSLLFERNSSITSTVFPYFKPSR